MGATQHGHPQQNMSAFCKACAANMSNREYTIK